MLPRAGPGSEAGDRVWNPKIKIKPEECSPVLDSGTQAWPCWLQQNLLPFHTDILLSSKWLLHSPLCHSFPGQSSSVAQDPPCQNTGAWTASVWSPITAVILGDASNAQTHHLLWYVPALRALCSAKELQTQEGFLWQSLGKAQKIPIHFPLSINWPKAPPAAQASAELLGRRIISSQDPTHP